jgi:hypothetical protein
MRVSYRWKYVHLKEVIPVVCVQLDIVGRDRQTQLSWWRHLVIKSCRHQDSCVWRSLPIISRMYMFSASDDNLRRLSTVRKSPLTVIRIHLTNHKSLLLQLAHKPAKRKKSLQKNAKVPLSTAGSTSSKEGTTPFGRPNSRRRHRYRIGILKNIETLWIKVKLKVKVTPEQATKAQRWSRGTALLFL